MLHTPEAQEKSRNARLETHVSSDQKAFFQRAASLTGRTLSELVVDSTQEAATKIVQEHEVIRLSREEQVAFVSASRSIAAVAVIVDAKNEQAEHFYRHFDFQPFQQTPLRLFLPMAQIAKLFA